MDRIIDKAAWPRREIFDFFSGISNPFYAVTFRQDVTELRNYCKERKISFYYGLIYLCCKALQDVPAFACRIRGENVVELGEQKPSFTDLKKGSELFHIVTMPCEGSIVEFCGKAREVTAVTNERELLAPNARDDSIPRICWGKYTLENDRVYLGISVEVNHRLIDGVHIGRFAEALTRRIQALK